MIYRGKLEPIRMLLEDANIDYKETRFTKENWPQNKQIGIDSGLYKFGQGYWLYIYISY